MALNREAFIDNFLDELNENIQKVDSSILVLKKDPENEEELNTLLRSLHTVKGSSRMLKFNTLEKIAHGIENVFKGIKDGRYGIDKQIVQLVFITTDYFKEGIQRIRETKSDDLPANKLLAAYEKAYANEPFSLEECKLPKKEAPVKEAPVSAETASEGPTGEADGGISSEAYDTGRADQTISEYESIRVKISKVDTIIKGLNNLIIRQFQFKKENDMLEELEDSFRSFMMLNHGDSGGDGEELTEALKLIQGIRKGFSEELTLMERSTFDVQEEILSLRMLPLDLILGSMGKMVEETAMVLNKEIDLSISGSNVLLDKLILERLNDPIIHIVRNSVDHGIETPEERERHGKPRVGKLEIKCSSESGNIMIRIKDDGRGIDYEKIRQKAIAANPMQEEEILAMDESALNSFIFQSGFSTNKAVNDLSGRGVGLDIVRFNIEKIKGKITLNSEKGTGTEFVLTLPLSLATVEGFFVRAGGEKFLIPSKFVKEIIIAEEEQKLDLLQRKAIKLRNKIIPIYYLADLLERDRAETGGKMFVMVVESMGEIIGLVVDSVIQYASLIYKPLPQNLSSLKIIQGIVFDESFNIVNIFYIPEVVKKCKSIRNIESKKRYSSKKREYKHVLVVDDSYSTREIERSILELEQYNVDTAVDGIDGLEKVRNKHFNLIITDINMPRMDGLTFVENLRREEQFKKIPIIVVSSEKNEAVKDSFAKAGANSYIDKTDFDRGNLLQEVKNLIG